jgi:hypothetical protein
MKLYRPLYIFLARLLKLLVKPILPRLFFFMAAGSLSLLLAEASDGGIGKVAGKFKKNCNMVGVARTHCSPLFM